MSGRNRVMKIAGTAAAAAGIFMGVGWRFFELMVHYRKRPDRKWWFQLTHIKMNHPSYKFEREYQEGKAWCRAQNMQDCYMRSRDGLMLHAGYLPAKGAKRIVLLSHGYKGSSFGDFAGIARFLHENGCHLLFLDQRCCGESEGEFITFGAREQYDVADWSCYLEERNPEKLPIYLYGESMGAAAVLMASGHRLPREVRGLIADCGFSSMKRQLRDMAADWFHLYWIGLLLVRVNLFCRLFAGFSMGEADIAGAMKVNQRPVLFFHGGKDTYVLPENSKYGYSLCQAPKELVLVPEARHLCSAYEEPERYRGKLMEFFEKYDRNETEG